MKTTKRRRPATSDGSTVSGLVATPGVVHHGLNRNVPEDRLEPVEVMAEASYALCTGDPEKLTGRVTYAKPILDELGIAVVVP